MNNKARETLARVRQYGFIALLPSEGVTQTRRVEEGVNCISELDRENLDHHSFFSFNMDPTVDRYEYAIEDLNEQMRYVTIVRKRHYLPLEPLPQREPDVVRGPMIDRAVAQLFVDFLNNQIIGSAYGSTRESTNA